MRVNFCERASPIYPFVTILEDIVRWAKETEQFHDKGRSIMTRLKSAVIEFAETKGRELGGAILKDVATRFDLDNTYELLDDFLKVYGEQRSVVMRAEDYIAKNQTEAAFFVYVGIFQSFAQEFKDRSFIFLFDQFESTDRASVDFLANFVKCMPERFHIVISFSDTGSRQLYEYAKKNLLKGQDEPLRLTGLSEEGIGQWIKHARNVELQTTDLQKIKKNSAGLPQLLNEWINQSKDLNYKEIDRSKQCKYTAERKKALEDNIENIVRLNKIAVLIQPLKNKALSIILDTKFDYIQPFVAKLIEVGLFEKRGDFAWFSNELVQKCLEDSLDEESKQVYHENAANFYLDLLEKNRGNEGKFHDINFGCAYHFHKAGKDEKSYVHNKKVAEFATKVGDFDRAEQCYRIAIENAKHLKREDDEKKCIFELSKVLMIWNRYNEAYKNFRELEKYFNRIGDVNFLPKVIFFIATIHRERGEIDEALRLYDVCFTMAMERDHTAGKEMVNYAYDEVIGLNDNYELTPELYNESLLSKLHLIENLNVGATAFSTANAYYEKGELANALKWYTFAEKVGELRKDELGKVIAQRSSLVFFMIKTNLMKR